MAISFTPVTGNQSSANVLTQINNNFTTITTNESNWLPEASEYIVSITNINSLSAGRYFCRQTKASWEPLATASSSNVRTFILEVSITTISSQSVKRYNLNYIDGEGAGTQYSSYYNEDDVLSWQKVGANINMINGDGTDSVVQVASSNANDANGTSAAALNENNDADGNYSFASGQNTIAYGKGAHTEGLSTIKMTTVYQPSQTIANIIEDWEDRGDSKYSLAKGEGAHIEGSNCLALDKNCHAEGNGTVASASAAHSEGTGSRATEENAHAGGLESIASGQSSFAHGKYIKATGNGGAAFGYSEDSDITSNAASCAFSAGKNVSAGHFASVAFGEGTQTEQDYQMVFGRFNDESTAQIVLGNGTTKNNRSNSVEIYANGNATFAGKLTVGTAPTNDLDVATKKYVDDNAGGGGATAQVVTFTEYGSTLSCDKTYAQVVQMLTNNNYIIPVLQPSGYYNKHQILSVAEWETDDTTTPTYPPVKFIGFSVGASGLSIKEISLSYDEDEEENTITVVNKTITYLQLTD